MSRRKPPVTTKAQREAMAEDWVKLREKIGDRMREAHEAHMYAFGALLNLELLFGQPPTPPESVQPAKPLTSGWRSMASALRDGTPVLLVMKHGGIHVADFEQSSGKWYFGGGLTLPDSDFVAWHRIPKWSGEVSE